MAELVPLARQCPCPSGAVIRGATAAAQSLPSSGSWCGRAATGRPELLRTSRPRLSSPYANSLCKKPRAQPLPGVEHHQHAQGHAALASLSQSPPSKDWHNLACRSPGCLQSCTSSVPAVYPTAARRIRPARSSFAALGTSLQQSLFSPWSFRAPGARRLFVPIPPFSQCCGTTPKMTRGA